MRDVKIAKILVRAANHSDCAHGCRYCPLTRKQSAIDIERYAAFVARVQDWARRRDDAPRVSHLLGYHWNYDRADLEVFRRLNDGIAVKAITLGGLPRRTSTQLRDWLAMLVSYGLQSIHATFAGHGETHDYWNNQPGNFDLLMRTLSIAREVNPNLKLGQRLLVGHNTLSTLDPLLRDLEALGATERDWRYAVAFFYQSEHQKPQPSIERARMDEAARAALPSRVARLFSRPDRNLSEREWIDVARSRIRPTDAASLVIRLSARTIEALERGSIEEIVAGLTMKVRETYALLPAFADLATTYGDRRATLIYASMRCVETKWLDLFRRDYPDLPIDQSLTHCWFGR